MSTSTPGAKRSIALESAEYADVAAHLHDSRRSCAVLSICRIRGPDPAACAAFALAGITDTLDGYYARKLGQTSRLGAFLDPGRRQAHRRRRAGADRQQGSALVRGHRRHRHHRPGDRGVGAARMDGGDRRARPDQGVGAGQVQDHHADRRACRCCCSARICSAFPSTSLGLVLTGMAAVLTLWSMVQYLRLAWPELRGSSEP